MTMANTPSVPYFNWFAEEVAKYPEIKFSFICLYHEKPIMIEEMKSFNCDCYWIKFDAKKRKKSMFFALISFIKLYKKIKPDIVHSHLFDDSLPSLIAARLTGIKKRIITKQDTTFHYYYAPKWVWADKFNNFNATNIIAVSNEVSKFVIEKERAQKKKLTTIHHGIPFKYLCKSDEELKKELVLKYELSNKIVIGTIARYIEWKGYRYIIDAAVDIIKKHSNAVFLFISTGEQREELEQLIKKNKLEKNIILTGWIDKKYIPSLYSLMNIYLHAANYEPFGFVIAEAMANKVPIVTTPTGAALDALEHKVNCYMTEYKNPQQIRDGVLWLLENKENQTILTDKAYQKAIEMYQFETMFQNHIKLYKSI